VSSVLPHVSVVVPARDAARTLDECLTSLARLDYPSTRREVIVVDNRSKDDTARIAAAHPEVRCVREERVGRSWARNRGVAESEGEVIAFTDADCVATTRWLRELAEPFADRGVAGAAGEIFAYPPRTAVERFVSTRHAYWQREALALSRPFAATANVAFRRRQLDRLGGFDTALPRAQDKDFSWRFFAAGLRLEYRPRAVVLHRHPQSVRGLFALYAAWGYGAALLHAKHDLPWGPRDELGKYRELAAALLEAVVADARRRLGSGGDPEAVAHRYLEVVRRLGVRAGALRGLAEAAAGRGPAAR
jgi:O-antigen biosynthesis protein